jgi:hypothetical protein
MVDLGQYSAPVKREAFVVAKSSRRHVDRLISHFRYL